MRLALCAAGLSLSLMLPAWAQEPAPQVEAAEPTRSEPRFDVSVDEAPARAFFAGLVVAWRVWKEPEPEVPFDSRYEPRSQLDPSPP